MDLATKIKDQLTYLYSNGKGEAGLEVGVDAGLSLNEYIRIPKSMKKQWAAKVNVNAWNDGTGHPALADAVPYNKDISLLVQSSLPGWVGAGVVRIYKNKKQCRFTHNGFTDWADIDELHVAPHSVDDFRRFYTANVGHIMDEDIDEKHKFWVHSVRLWSVIGGLVTTTKNKEYIEVDDPQVLDPQSEEFAKFAIDYAANAWTACAARTTSWKKSNHATGGTPAIGLPRRWMQKEGIWPTNETGHAARNAEIRATSAFYVATHATSVHAVLSQFVPEDDHHWSIINPCYGFLNNWDIGESVRLRMSPREQVAGAAMVVDAIVVFKMMVSEGIAPALEYVGQAQQLVSAYNYVQRHGMLCAVYRKWYFEDYPGFLPTMDFSQRSSNYFDLISELAIIAVKYYAGSTISQSPALQNAARQSSHESIKHNWAAASISRMELSSGDLSKIINLVRGITGTAFIQKIASKDVVKEMEGVEEFNIQLTSLGHMIGIDNVKQLDAARVHDLQMRD